MRFLTVLLGSSLMAMTSVQAELIINGRTVTVEPTTPILKNVTTNNDFQRCLADLRPQVLAKGVSAAPYDRYTQNSVPDYSILEKLNYQPEFSTPIWDY